MYALSKVFKLMLTEVDTLACPRYQSVFLAMRWTGILPSLPWHEQVTIQTSPTPESAHEKPLAPRVVAYTTRGKNVLSKLLSTHVLGSISAALLCPVYVPPREGGTQFPSPEQRLLISGAYTTVHTCTCFKF